MYWWSYVRWHCAAFYGAICVSCSTLCRRSPSRAKNSLVVVKSNQGHKCYSEHLYPLWGGRTEWLLAEQCNHFWGYTTENLKTHSGQIVTVLDCAGQSVTVP
jgi:hypothetical protein